MFLSINRVLQLLAEGKNIDKISELAGCSEQDVVSVINEARMIIEKYDKSLSRKKVILRKKIINEGDADFNPEAEYQENIFNGSDFSAIPLGSHLIMYVDGDSDGDPGPSGIGIVIHDKDGNEVGKVSSYLGRKRVDYTGYFSIIRALKIAEYFEAKSVKIRTDLEFILKQINGDYRITKSWNQVLCDQVIELKKTINEVKFELVTKNLNDKADYLARQAYINHLKEKNK